MTSYSFRDGEEEAAYQLWPTDEESILLHPHCTRTPNEREFPLYVDDLIEGNSFQEPLICDRCNGEILIGRIVLSDALERCGYCNKQIVQAVCGSGYVHAETGLTACIVAHPTDPLSPKATRLSHHVRRCSAQACGRGEGHDGNHWCSVCNERDLAGVAYDEHECYPREKGIENR